MKEIFPALGQEVKTHQEHSRLYSFWFSSYSINSSRPVAKRWIEVLQTLTSYYGLVFLTMVPWGETIAPDELIRSKKAWCPWCYEEWQSQSKVVYEPLLWGLDGIDICLRHQQPLVNRCPQCQAMSPFLTQSSRPGYCPYCASWLGNGVDLQGSVLLSTDEPELERQLWGGKGVGELLATVPQLLTAPAREQIAKMLDICLTQYARGNVSALSRMLGLNIPVVWGYLRKGKKPTFKNLLHMCHTFSISPLEFLTTSITSANPPLNGPQFVLDQLPTVPRAVGQRITEEDIRAYRLALEQVLALDEVEIPSLSAGG